MDFVWTTTEHTPSGSGFALFGIQHFCILAAIVLLIVAASILLHRHREKVRLVTRICGWILFGMEVLKLVVLFATGQFLWVYLPLDLCDLSVFMILVFSYWHNAYLGECIFSLSLPGACLALIYPNWTNLPLYNFFNLHAFVMHALLVITPAILLTTGEIRPSFKRLPVSFLCILVACIPISICNVSLGTNFFFLSYASKNSPLVWFGDVFGEYRIGLPILMAAIWLVMYGITYGIRAIRRKRKIEKRLAKAD